MALAVYLAFCAILGLGVGLTTGSVGKPRAPIAPAVAVATLFLGVLEFAAISYLYFN